MFLYKMPRTWLLRASNVIVTVCRTSAVPRETERRASGGRKWRHDHVQCARCTVVMATRGRGSAAWSRDVRRREAASARRQTQWCGPVRVHGHISWSVTDHRHNHPHWRHTRWPRLSVAYRSWWLGALTPWKYVGRVRVCFERFVSKWKVKLIFEALTGCQEPVLLSVWKSLT